MLIKMNDNVDILFCVTGGYWHVCVHKKVVTEKVINSKGQIYYKNITFECKKDAIDYCVKIGLISRSEFDAAQKE